MSTSDDVLIIEQLTAVFTKQKQAVLDQPTKSLATRVRQLTDLRQSIIQHQDDLCHAIGQDFGHRSHDETKLGEIMTVIDHINQTIKHLPEWIKPDNRLLGVLQQPAKGWVQYQPLGVVGIISPWNYPIVLSIGPLISALAAGNRAIMKPSSKLPNYTALMQTIISETFTEDEVVMFGGSSNVANTMSLMAFDQLTFTGSGQVAETVMANASKNLVPVLLELGGKSPALIHDDMDFDEAALRLTFGKLFNAGQTCVAPDYALVPKGRAAEFATAMQAQIAHSYPTLKDNPDYSCLIDDRSYQRLTEWVEQAESLGATVTKVNPANEDLADSGKFIPTLITQTTDEMTICQQEIFGPVLPIIEYNHLDDAIRYINARPKPLALYYFDYDGVRFDYVAQRTSSGHIGNNQVLTHVAQDCLPFGGVGASGMGKYHGFEGFQTMSNARSVIRQGKIFPLKLFKAPYGGKLMDILYNQRIDKAGS